MECEFLNYWNVDCFAHYLSQIQNKAILSLASKETTSITVNLQALVYVLSGEISVQMSDHPLIVQTHECFFAKEPEDYLLKGNTETSQVLIIHFKFFALSTDELTGHLPCFQQFLINLPLHIPLKKQNACQLLFGAIQQEIEKPAFDSASLMASSLTNIILQLLRLARQPGDAVLNNVSGVAFYSKGNHYHPLEAGRTIWFTDVHIWSKKVENPDAENLPSLLGILRAHGSELSIPNDGSVILNHENEFYCGQQVSSFTAVNRTPYHVWVWPSYRLHLDLRPIREEYHITFHIKSNMTGNIGFTLTNIENYNDLPEIIAIDKPNTWIPVCITGHSVLELPPSSPYVIQAVMYIQENYTRSLRVGEIAEHCHISAVHLSRLFKEQTGDTIVDFIALCRIQKARDMLLHTTATLEEITHAVGFYDLQHFSRTFTHYIGLRPSVYRKIYRNI